MNITDGETNATLRFGDTLEFMTLERVLELSVGRRAREAERAVQFADLKWINNHFPENLLSN